MKHYSVRWCLPSASAMSKQIISCAEPQKQIPFWRPQQLKPRLSLSHADESVLKEAGWGAQGPGSWDPDFLASEEDKLIVEARRMGMEWQAIAKHLPNRTVASMRKQFGNAKIRPRVGKDQLCHLSACSLLVRCSAEFSAQWPSYASNLAMLSSGPEQGTSSCD